ncbi:glycolate oxidase iron-sulfur subunit [Desulfotomaculum arcticum]|uniref:Glycolate oxidase iron-sulfur subunit n=1 Tax=Desulfotruncus arcticus DSM 17038 TaxID=1121424 RepID=A0A1I2PAZ6_9FIRM|nr:(Fe-S)-binding protein [Desulfotruncus arcticus]SFG12683.1 glycolate oxidase iron-sulfur subunit [Desulfotomaculum arcticum] [Desulfotruncus arcticus DSM 17038]
MDKKYLQMIGKCSRCGGCQAHCPLYLETGREPFVARGKIELLDNLAAGKLVWNDKLAEVFSTCLLCGSCTENCPNGVEPDKLVRLARKDLVAARGLPIIKRNVLQHLLKHNGRLNTAGRLLGLYQKSKLQLLIRNTGFLKLISTNLANIEGLLPQITGQPFRKNVPLLNTVDAPRLKVAYFTGCATNWLNPHIGRSVVKVLKAYGVEVVVPEQYCCGVPALSSGDMDTGRYLARENIRNFSELDVDYIITDCASCLSAWLEYPELLENDDALNLAARVMDINRLLVEILDVSIPAKESGVKVTYHDPCHLKRTPGGRTSPRELLKRLSPYYEFVEMDLADRCCGSAGSFNISHYELSQSVVKHKVASILDSKAEIVATACPSCMMQLGHGLKKNNSDVKVQHTIELLAHLL